MAGVLCARLDVVFNLVKESVDVKEVLRTGINHGVAAS